MQKIFSMCSIKVMLEKCILPGFDCCIVKLTAFEAISHVFLIKFASADDLMSLSSCKNSSGDWNNVVVDRIGLRFLYNFGWISSLFSYQTLTELNFDTYFPTNCDKSPNGCASSTPKKSTECSTPVRGPSQSSSWLFFGRINRADFDWPSSSVHSTNILSGSRQPVK